MTPLIRTAVLGFWLASALVRAQRCDSLRIAYSGRWHWDGDTLYIRGGFLTAYPRLGPIGPTPPPGYYTWYWWLNQLQGGSYFRSGSLIGGFPTLNVPLNFSAHPTFYELWMIVYGQDTSGANTCTDSIRIIIRGDTFPPSPWANFCRDSILLQIGGQTVRPNQSISLPLGSYPFSLSVPGDFRGWFMTGPSPSQGRSDWRNYPAGTILDTAHLTAPGTHIIHINFYNGMCFDTFTYIINVTAPSPTQNCADTVQYPPCLPMLVVNNASYLPGAGTINLATGTYLLHLQPAHPPVPGNALYQYEWTLSGPPHGTIQGTSNTVPIHVMLASYLLQVRVRAYWFCPITQSCDRIYTFVLSGVPGPNDTIVLSYPTDTTTYLPGDTIPLPVDTVCLYAGLQTPHPDSAYWWYWTYYGPTGIPLDSGITPITCVYPRQPGVYRLTYGVQPVSNQRVTQHRSYNFYLHFGGRTTALSSTAATGLPLIYPNPTTGPIWLTLPEAIPYRLTIMEPTGRVIEQLTLAGEQTHLLPLRLAKGVYILRAESSTKVFTLRLVVSD